MSLSLSIARTIRAHNLSLADTEEVLRKYKLLSLLPLIYKHLLREKKEEEKKSVVQIESPYSLSAETVSIVKKRLNAEDKEHNIVITPELLAGFRAKYNDVLYDGSAKRIVDMFTKN